MAINVSSAHMTDTQRQDLLGTNVDTSPFGGVTANTQKQGGFLGFGGEYVPTGAELAGITGDFVQTFSAAIDTYCTDVETTLNELEAVATSGAFQGSGVSKALSAFVTSVRDVAISYVTAVKHAENEIIESVKAAYAQQDTDLSGDLSSDTSTLEGMRAGTSGN